MTVIDTPPLVEHVVGFGGLRVRATVGGDVGADGRQQVSAVTDGGDGGANAGELTPVVEQDLAVAREIVLLEGRGGEIGRGGEKEGEARGEGFALEEGRCVRVVLGREAGMSVLVRGYLQAGLRFSSLRL